ncbi:MAG: D-glycero-beta-D-manno-heptose 1-phosphate adenylyltransferase [Thermodesulfobacteriota bacterium]|nr:D-glycero-beta-D-manno-heptose 1-phosphate adenylyltransferase [Thermodesulfobacteriota bacterium]
MAGRLWPSDLVAVPKVLSADALEKRAGELRQRGMKIVFTNGCFDLLHAGHVEYLQKARCLGDCLVVGLNSDESVRRLGKAENRPINDQASRAYVLSGLSVVDLVCIFDEDTPINLIEALRPDVLVQGGDWKVDDIVGADIVRSNGGRVLSIDLKEGYSTTAVIEKIRGAYP